METIRFEDSGRHFRNARAVVTERTGGTSEGRFASLNLGHWTPDDSERVRENERRALAGLGLGDSVARVQLEHGAKILYASEPGVLGSADALWTDRPDLVLSLTVADCYPVAIVAGDRRALVHCGWRGVAAGILENAVAVLRADQDLRAWIGPGICAQCYPVGPEVARLFPGATRPIAGTDRSGLDLRGDISARLRALGLGDDAIAVSASCTAEEPARFFSHRRDGFPAGRMAAFLFVDPPQI